MKTIASTIIVCLSLFFITSCSKETTQKDSGNGTIQFSFGTSELKSAIVDTSVKTTEMLTSIIITVVNEKNEVIFNLKKIRIYKMGSGYYTESITLPVGKYTLKSFAVFDSLTNSIKYVCPVAGSERAQLVTKPLPLYFEITLNKVLSYVIPEVLSVANVSPEQYGYTQFSFAKKSTSFVKIKVTTLDSLTKDTISVSANLEARPAITLSIYPPTVQTLKYSLKEGVNTIEIISYYSCFKVSRGLKYVIKQFTAAEIELMKTNPAVIFIPLK